MICKSLEYMVALLVLALYASKQHPAKGSGGWAGLSMETLQKATDDAQLFKNCATTRLVCA